VAKANSPGAKINEAEKPKLAEKILPETPTLNTTASGAKHL